MASVFQGANPGSLALSNGEVKMGETECHICQGVTVADLKGQAKKTGKDRGRLHEQMLYNVARC
jgi:hypothetical protein